MVKFCFRLLFILFLPTLVYSQEDNFYADSGFVNNSVVKEFTNEEIHAYVFGLVDSSTKSIIGGNITSIFHEQVDSTWIIFTIDKLKTDSLFSRDGLFRIPIEDGKKEKLIELKFRRSDYHLFDTSLIVKSSGSEILSILLIPKFKISLRGRVFAGNLPLDGVKVSIRENDKIYLMETRGCFYDKENYWNCLYNGMFKQDLIVENSNDSINLSFEKAGMKPLSVGMVLADYSGDIMEVKMKYTSKLPVQTNNCLSLKLAFPFISSNSDWLIDLSYYRTLKIKNLNRISVGLDASLILSPVSVSDTTFLNNTATFDTSYISGYVGPSILFWLIRPENRYFSTYAGLTAGIGLDDGDFFFQPFIGTRIFVDFNKSISIELRHVSYDLEIVRYTFNAYGNAYRSTTLENFQDYLLDVGIQIVF